MQSHMFRISLMNTKMLLLFIFALLSSACADTFAPYDTIIKTWIGKTEENVYQAYGAPQQTKEINGTTYAKYQYQEIETSNSSGVYTLQCEINFVISHGSVSNASYNGNYGLVKQHVVPPPDLSQSDRNKINESFAENEDHPMRWFFGTIIVILATSAILVAVGAE